LKKCNQGNTLSTVTTTVRMLMTEALPIDVTTLHVVPVATKLERVLVTTMLEREALP
jgi:hypothetical protein